MYKALFAHQETQHHQRRNGLRNHRSHRRADDTHIKTVNQDGIQDQIQQCAHTSSGHTGFCVPLIGDKGIQAQRNHDKKRTNQIDAQVSRGIRQRLCIGTEKGQDRITKHLKHNQKCHRNTCKHTSTLAENLCGFLIVPLPHGNSGTGRAACTNQLRKRCDNHGNRQHNTQSCQSQRSRACNMPHKSAIHHIVEKIDHLRQD